MWDKVQHIQHSSDLSTLINTFFIGNLFIKCVDKLSYIICDGVYGISVMENSKLQLLYTFGFGMVEEEIVYHNFESTSKKTLQIRFKRFGYVIGKLIWHKKAA